MVKCSYLDPLQNHKYDDRIVFKDNDVIVCPSADQHLLQMARSLGTHGKHVGSKPIRRIKNAVNQIQQTRKAVEDAAKRIVDNEEILSKEQ